MALRDEFEYLTFRCAYCYHVNQARKKKPTLTETVSTASLSGKQSPEESDTQGADQNDGSNEATDQPLRDEVWTHVVCDIVLLTLYCIRVGKSAFVCTHHH